MVVIDLDRFKQVNDVHGHEIGDRVLVAVVRRLAATVRDADLLGRWADEEVLLIAPDTDHDDAVALAERCRWGLHTLPTDPVGVVTASFGVATIAPDDDARSLMRRADLALYAAKREGRDRVVGIPDIEAARLTDAGGDVDAVHDTAVEPNCGTPRAN